MIAARFVGPGLPLALDEVPAPTPGPGEVVVRVEAAGLCHSDIHVIEGMYRMPVPLTLGHECCGVISATGPDVAGVAEGTRVVVFGPNSCGGCRACRRGEENLCSSGPGAFGLGVDGAFAEYALVPARSVLPVPEGVEPAGAAVATDAVLTPYHALRTVAGVRAGDVVAIVGLGGLGLHAVQVGRLLGASVLAVDTNPAKLEAARTVGAETVATDLKTAAGGGEVDVVADFVGVDATIVDAQKVVRPGGRVVLVGLGTRSSTLLTVRFGSHQIAVLGSYWGTALELAQVLRLIAEGRLVPDVETHPLAEVNEWVERLREGEVRSRVALVP